MNSDICKSYIHEQGKAGYMYLWEFNHKIHVTNTNKIELETCIIWYTKLIYKLYIIVLQYLCKYWYKSKVEASMGWPTSIQSKYLSHRDFL